MLKILLYLLLLIVVISNLFNLPEESFSPLVAWKRAIFKGEKVYGDNYYLTIEWLKKGNFNLYLNETLFYDSYDLEKQVEAIIVYPWFYQEKLKNHNRIFNVAVLEPVVTGFLAKKILSVPFFGKIDFYTDDMELYYFFKDDSFFSKLAQNSLLSRKLSVKKVDDFYNFSPSCKYDFIYLNFLDPYNESKERLYSEEYFRKIKTILTDDGIAVINGTSPFFTRKSFSKIYSNLKNVFEWVKPYWISLSQQGEWGYFLVSSTPHSLTNEWLFSKLELDVLNKEYLKVLSQFPKDLLPLDLKEINKSLSFLYTTGWKEYINVKILEKEIKSE